MSKRDYYEVLGVARTATDERDQERLSQAGDEVSPGPQSGRQDGRGANSRKRPRRTRSSPTPRSAACYDRFGHAGVARRPARAAASIRRCSAEFGDIVDILGNMFGFGDLFGGGRRRGGPQRGADLRYDLEITFEESAQGRRDDDPDSAPGKLRDVQRLRARRRAPVRRPVRSAAARVRSASSRASSPSRAPARSAAAAGKVITKPCADVPRRRTRQHASGRSRSRFRPASRPASSSACRAKAKPAPPAARPGISTSSSTCRSTSSSGATATNLFCEIPVNFTTLALGGEIQVPTLDGPRNGQGARRARRPARRCGLRGKGMPDVNGRGRGDLFATVQGRRRRS